MRNLKWLGVAIALVVVTAGCQQGKSQKRGGRGVGRTAVGLAGTDANGRPSPLNPTSANTLWGEITNSAGDQAFYNEIYYFTYPAMNGAPDEDQIGSVSSFSGQSTGVRFWGVVPLSRTLNGSVTSGTFHLEIYDNKYGTQRSNGTTIEPFVFTIDSSREGFKSVKGQANGTSAQVTFESDYGTVFLDGALQNQYFVGRIQYYNSATSGQWRSLGQFRVSKCGFFTCN